MFTFVCFLGYKYQVKMLLDATRFYSLGLLALRIQVCRTTGQELVPCAYDVVEDKLSCKQ
ncbi:unnamed protein product [Brassica napus]|uniref:(rape) hypothetical protein n=1 Tax=Brassica napus TaxID=3708 RepID=A0A817AU71_BRANA|nr:unnamed protein product [Brassica napus]